MNSHDRIRHSVLVDLLRRARRQLPNAVDQKDLDGASDIDRLKLILAIDIDTVFEKLWQQDLLPHSDMPSMTHTVDASIKNKTIL